MNLRIELSQNPTEEQRQAILKPLRAYNGSKAEGNVPEHIALLAVSYTHLTLPTNREV